MYTKSDEYPCCITVVNYLPLLKQTLQLVNDQWNFSKDEDMNDNYLD